MNNFQISKKYSFVTRQTLASWENGEAIPQEKKIKKLVERGVNVDRFIDPTIKKLQGYHSSSCTASLTEVSTPNKVCSEGK